MTDAQRIFADNVASMLGRIDSDDERRSIRYALQRFERAHWYPEAFDMAMNEFPSITFEDSYIPSDDVPLIDVREAVERYIDIVEEKTGTPAIENELFSKRAATWYIVRKLNQRGVKATPRGIDFHLRDKGELKSDLIVGKTQLLTRKELDAFVDNFDNLPKRGRPAKVEPSKS